MNANGTLTARRQVSSVTVTNAFLRSVYNWMGLGLGITALLAALFAYTDLRALPLSPGGQNFGLVAMIAEVALVFYLSLRIQKLSAGAATGIFLLYSALNGFTLSFILMLYSNTAVAQAFISTAGMFGAMSLYGLYTKKDLAGWGSLLFMGLVGLLIAMVVNIFLGSSLLGLGISLVGVIIFLGLTAYDTQLLKEMGQSVPHDDPTAVRRGAILGALRLYLDFINLFLMILRFVGDRR
jgi:FtsH-binding integral membrane protein